MSKKTIIGITGRTGSGKSLACEWIKQNISKVEHIDCDEIGHNVLKKIAIKQQLIETFGESIIENNEINRTSLGTIVFNDKKKLNQLNEIVHPEICNKVNEIIKETNNITIIVEGALIHQVGLEDICNTTICIDAPTTDIISRDHNKEIILTKQPSSKDYINMCHHTIKNNTTITLYYEKLEKLLEKLGV